MRQGNRLYNTLAYSQAVTEYQKALSKKEFPGARVQLAKSYLKMNDLKNAQDAYAIAAKGGKLSADDQLEYARLLMREGQYDTAKTYFDRYIQSKPTDNTAKELRKGCDSIAAWKADSLKYTVESTKLNSGQTNFSPVYYKDGVVFVSDRNDKGAKYEWTGRPFLDMYYAKMDGDKGFGNAERLQGEVNGAFHDGPATFMAKGDTMYFTRNSYVKKKVKRSQDDVVMLKIYSAVKKDTVWKDLKEFEYNSKEYSTGHPTLSSDGQTMYFVSDMPGGAGGSDLYMTKMEGGKWSKPVNMTALNTPYNESFPTLWNDTVLYFSSDGRMGMGGLDVYRSAKSGEGWSSPEHMSYPLNTSYDDFGIAMKKDGSVGLISSNRNPQITTQDNIYAFTVNDMRFTLEGMAVNKATQEPVAGVLVELTNVKTGEKETATTDKDGKFKFKLNPNTDYTVVGSKDTYYTNTEKVSTVGKKQSESMFVKLKLEMEEIVVNKPIVLENIYYDLDKYNIRPDAAQGLDKLVKIMKDNPEIKIELSSHTDSRADDKYNMVLSQRRAESAVKYITDHGIAKDRITAHGYGESRLVNRCTNGVKCSEEEHQANRRTEFKVVAVGSSKK